MNKKEKEFLKSWEKSIAVQANFENIENRLNYPVQKKSKKGRKIGWFSLALSCATCLVIAILIIVQTNDKNNQSPHQDSLNNGIVNESSHFIPENSTSSFQEDNESSTAAKPPLSSSPKLSEPQLSTVHSPSLLQVVMIDGNSYEARECEEMDQQQMLYYEQQTLQNNQVLMIYQYEESFYGYLLEQKIWYKLYKI